MKTIVAHIGPDQDAITSIWLVKTFWPGWEEASFAFVPAGKTLNGMEPDSDPDILHVDTGFGKFDHHQTDADTCAAKLVYEEIVRTKGADPALERMVAVVNDIDHFKEVFFRDASADYMSFTLWSLIDGWRLLHSEDPYKIVELGMQSLDAVYKGLQNKIWAESEMEKGLEFQTRWGKGMAFETVNDEVIHVAQKKGYVMAVRKDPKKKYLRIKSLPKPEIDLEPLYNELKKQEPDVSWFLHASHHMVLNGSAKNPDMKPSEKPLADIVSIIERVCV